MFWQDPTNSIVEPRHEGTGARQSVEPTGSRNSLASTQNCDSRLQRSRQSESAPAIPSTRCTLSCRIAFLSYFYHCLECVLFFLQQNVKMRQGIGDVRRVTLHKKPNEGLGISVTVRMLCPCTNTGCHLELSLIFNRADACMAYPSSSQKSTLHFRPIAVVTSSLATPFLL